MDLNITYLTKCLSSDNSGIDNISKSLYIFSYFLKYIGNDLKIGHLSLFQTSSCIAKLKQKSVEY